MASNVTSPASVVDNAHEWLETAPTLIDFVRHVDVDRILCDADEERFEALEYDAAPTVRALFCRELAGLSWNGLYEFLSTDQILQPPVTAAIDITTWPYHAEDDLPSEVSGTKRTDETAYKFATLSLVGKSMPIVFADRGFESMNVYQTLDNLDVQYILPKIERSDELESIERMDQDGEAVAVERVTVAVETGSHECRILYVPGGDGETHAFITNKPIAPVDAEAWVEHYAYRWCIENEYRSIKQEFLAKTSSKDHELRIYYFVFGILMYNVWRLTDVLLKATVSQEITDYTPVLTAGELADWIAIHLQLGPG